MKHRAYSIIAATCHGNRGAQAMLETVVGRLRRDDPGLRFHVFSYYPEEDRRLVADPGITVHSSTPLALVAWLAPWALLFGLLRRVVGRRALRLAPASIRALSESEALIDLAGVSFIDGREKFLPFNALTIIPAWLLGVKVIKMPQALGPFERPLNRWLARVVLPMCAVVWARGDRTRMHLEQAAFRGVSVRQADDIAFNHLDEYRLCAEANGQFDALMAKVEAARAAPGVRGVIGVCPSSVVAVKSRKQGGGYEDALAGLMKSLVGDGFVVVLFPNATRFAAGGQERNNDLPLMRRLVDRGGFRADDGRLVVFDMDIDATGIKHVIRSADVVVVSRFHAMVGALAAAVPPAVLGWSHKYAEVMARFGLESEVIDYAESSAGELAARTRRLFVEREHARARILERLADVRESAGRPFVALATQGPGAGADA